MFASNLCLVFCGCMHKNDKQKDLSEISLSMKRYTLEGEIYCSSTKLLFNFTFGIFMCVINKKKETFFLVFDVTVYSPLTVNSTTNPLFREVFYCYDICISGTCHLYVRIFTPTFDRETSDSDCSLTS